MPERAEVQKKQFFMRKQEKLYRTPKIQKVLQKLSTNFLTIKRNLPNSKRSPDLELKLSSHTTIYQKNFTNLFLKQKVVQKKSDKTMSQVKAENLTKFSAGGTLLFLIVGVIASIESKIEILFVIVSLSMFAIGVLLGLRAFLQSISRSRFEVITTIDLIKLPQNTSSGIKATLYGSLAIEIIGSVIFASIQSSTNFAFGILASLFALGNLNMWAIMNGTFKKRPT